MKYSRFLLALILMPAFVAGSILRLASGASTTMQVGGPCSCILDSQFSPGSGTLPPCVHSYGLTFNNVQHGVCAAAGCPTPRQCTSKLGLSVNADSGCPWEIDLNGGGTAQGSGSHSFTIDLALSCGSSSYYGFEFGGVDGGTFTVTCAECDALQ